MRRKVHFMSGYYLKRKKKEKTIYMNQTFTRLKEMSYHQIKIKINMMAATPTLIPIAIHFQLSLLVA